MGYSPSARLRCCPTEAFASTNLTVLHPTYFSVHKNNDPKDRCFVHTERVGFEPTEELPLRWFSRPEP